MSALSYSDVAILIRQRMGAPVADRLRFHALINLGLKLLANEVALDPAQRHLMLTDPATATVALDGAGVADLTALLASPRILPDKLQYGNIYHVGNVDHPDPLVERRSGTSRLPGNFDVMYLHYWMQGVKLNTISEDNNATPLTGSLGLAVPYWATLAQLSEQLIEPLVEKCTELLIENKADYESEADDEQ